MSLKQDFIVPEPNANPHAKGKQELPIAPISCWPAGIVSSVLAFPTTLDEDRLRKAIARAAAFWPPIAGRFVKSSTPGTSEFAISLTNSPIPFSTQTTTDDYPYANKNVIQQSLGEYAPQLDPKFAVAGADVPLIAFRFSKLASGGSVLGVAWGHILGDAAAYSRLLEDIALFYNLPSMGLGEDVPTFEPHVRIPPVTDEIRRDYELEILKPIPMEDMIKGYTDSAAQSQSFTVTLNRDELKHITSARMPGENLSDNDMLCGWWVGVLERAGMPIDSMVQTINYRSFHKGHPAFPPSLPNLVANVAQMRKIPLAPRSRDAKPAARAAVIARTLRGGMNQLRDDPDVMLDWLSNAAYEIGTAAHEGKAQCLVPPSGGVVLNSNLRYDWAIKFGQPAANYHTDITILRFLRVFQANARPGAEASDERDIELGFRIDWGSAAEAVERVIAEDRAEWAKAPAPDHTATEEESAEAEVKTYNSGNNLQAQLPWGGNHDPEDARALGPRRGEPTARTPWNDGLAKDGVAPGPRSGEPSMRAPFGIQGPGL